MSPSSGKGMRPEAVSVRLGVHLKKVIFLLNQYAAVDARWVNAEEDGWWHRGVSPRFSHQSSCWLRSLRCQQPSHKRPVYVFHSLLHAAARLKWRYRFSQSAFPNVKVGSPDEPRTSGHLKICVRPKVTLDGAHPLIQWTRTCSFPTAIKYCSEQRTGLHIQQTKRIEKWLII